MGIYVVPALARLGYLRGVDYECVDWADGAGQQITAWLSPDPQPSSAEIAAVEEIIDQECIKKTYSKAVQAYLDAEVAKRDYDSIHTAALYKDSSNPIYAAEGQACFVWMSDVWTYVEQVWADVQADPPLRTSPTVSELLAELPTLTWP